jgi:hypothetical protein
MRWRRDHGGNERQVREETYISGQRCYGEGETGDFLSSWPIKTFVQRWQGGSPETNKIAWLDAGGTVDTYVLHRLN